MNKPSRRQSRSLSPRRARRSRSLGPARAAHVEALEARMMLAGDTAAFQNPVDPLDVNADGAVVARDALLVMSALAHSGPRLLELAGFPAAAAPARGSGTASLVPEDDVDYVDVSGDSFLSSRDALLVVGALQAEGEPGDVATFRLETTDLGGTVISQIEVGQEFLLRVWVQDTRESAEIFGIGAAFLDIEWEAAQASVSGDLAFGDAYPNGRTTNPSVTATPGLLDEAGAFTGFDAPGPDELLLLSVPLRADQAGQVTFAADPADQLPASEVLTFDPVDTVSPDDIAYGTATITITGGAQQDEDPDLVAFAQALADSGAELWVTDRCQRCTNQRQLFEDGAQFLPVREVLAPDGSIRPEAEAADVDTLNTWIFANGNRHEGATISLQEISELSGIAIPTGFAPSLAPIEDVTVLAGSPLHIPLDGYDPNGGPLSYTVTSDDPTLLATFLPQGNRSLRIDVLDFGQMVFQLYEGRAPRATEQIITLAEVGFYDDVIFHRVINNFMIQGGDPLGTGSGGSQLPDFDDQFHVDLQHNRPGVLSMAKAGDDTNNSQFFITEVPTRHLDFNHTIFGQLVEGDWVREAISNVPTGAGDRPLLAVQMGEVDVFQDSENAVVMLKADEGQTGSTSVTVTVTDQDGNSTSQTVNVTVSPDPVDNEPFLEDIAPVVTDPGTPVSFTLSAVDIDGGPLFFHAERRGGPEFDVSVTSEGVVTVTPPADFSGTLPVFVRVSSVENPGPLEPRDEQLVQVRVLPGGPAEVDLLAESDLGISDSDNLTSASELRFRVTGVQDGATVKLRAGETEIGEAVASGDSVVVTTSNLSALGDGQYTITAVQEVDGVTTAPSPPLTVTLDQTPPVADFNAAPETAVAGEPYAFDVQHEEEGTPGFRYSLASAPAGATIDPVTGELNWTPTADQAGENVWTVVATDAAGNFVEQPYTVEVSAADDQARFRLQITDSDGNPLNAIVRDATFELRVFVADLRDDATGIQDAFLDIEFDTTSATVTSGLIFGDDFTQNRTSDTSFDGIEEAGAGSSRALGAGEFLLFRVPMQALDVGTIVFASNPADDAGHDVRFFDAAGIVDPADIDFGTAALTVLTAGQQLTARNDGFSIPEDIADLRMDVLINDQLGPESREIRISNVSPPTAGSRVTITPDGLSLRYTAAQDYFGEESFTYTIEDDLGATSQATVSITLNNVNDPPVANPDFFPDQWEPDDPRRDLLFEDSTEAVALNVLGNDDNGPDPDDDINEIFFVVDAFGGSGTLEVDQLGVRYTPAPDFFGDDVFTYVVEDQNGEQAQAEVTVRVAEVNDPPELVDDVITVPGGGPVVIDVSQLLANDSAGPNEDEQVLTIVGVEATGQGVVTLSEEGTLTYVPPAGFVGQDSFTITVEDNGTTRGVDDFLQGTSQVTVNVTEGNSPPIAFDDRFTVQRDSVEQSLNVLANDTTQPDIGETLTIASATAGSAGGQTQVNAARTRILYTPAAGFIGTETFTYTVSDGNGGTDEATVTITVQEEAVTSSSFAGLVYFDTNGNAQQDDHEQGLSGVTVRLSGSDRDGNPVARETKSLRNGEFRFDSLPPGEYMIEQGTLSFVMDGQDTASLPATVADNDMISLPLNGEDDGSQGNTFGELGMLPDLTIFGALASSKTDGVLAAVAAESAQWTQMGSGWDQFAAVELVLSEDLSEVTITAVDDASNTREVTVSTADKSRVHLLGRRDGVTLVRLNGASSEFFPASALVQSRDSLPPATTNSAATDAAFASGDIV